MWFDGQTPFYVGIGDEHRLKRRERNKWATTRRKEAESRGTFKQEIVFKGPRQSCIETEKFLISQYKSVRDGGCLFNFTEGGDGGDTFSLLPPEKQENVRNGAKKVAEAHAKSNGRKNGSKLFINKKGLFDPNNKEAILKGRQLGAKNQSKEDKSRGGRLGAKNQHQQKWKCTVTGYISSPCGLSSYQKGKGIDFSNRERVS